MSDIMTIVAANPGIAGFALFVLVFLPLLAYVIRWAEKSTDSLRNTYEIALEKSEKREDKLTRIINGSLADQTKVLGQMNTSLTMMHANMSNLSNRVEDIEKVIEKGV